MGWFHPLLETVRSIVCPSNASGYLTAASVNAATVYLRIIESTDLHRNMMDFDYYKNTEKFGLVYTASLINSARNEVKNSVLVDNGDLIQGSSLGDYMAAKGLKEGDAGL